MSMQRNRHLSLYAGLAVLLSYSQQANSVQMLVSPSPTANQVNLSFFPDANETQSNLSSVTCPNGISPTIQSGSNVATCTVPESSSNEYVATYNNANLTGTLHKNVDLELPEESILQALIQSCANPPAGSPLAARCSEIGDFRQAANAMVASQSTAQMSQILKSVTRKLAMYVCV